MEAEKKTEVLVWVAYCLSCAEGNIARRLSHDTVFGNSADFKALEHKRQHPDHRVIVGYYREDDL